MKSERSTSKRFHASRVIYNISDNWLCYGWHCFGISLLNQSKLQSIITEVNTFKLAINTFHQKYGCLPGDFPAASSVWNTTCDPTPSNCNGNGDGIINYTASLIQNEGMRAWQHMNLAGILPGNYTGIATVGKQTDIGINGPSSKYTPGGYMIYPVIPYAPPSSEGQYLQLATFDAGSYLDNPLLNPFDAYSIDIKIDNGYLRNEMVWGYQHGSNYGCYASNSTTIPYNNSSSTIGCAMKFTFRKSVGWDS